MNEKEIIAKLQLLREIKPEKEWVAVTKEKIIPQKRQSMWELFNYFGSKVFRPELRPAFAMSVFLAVIMGIALFGLISIDKTQAPVISINPNVNFNDPSEYLALAEKKIQEIEKIAQDDGDGRIVGILQDTQTAIEKAADRTPSTAFRELLWGMKSTITTGGNLQAFLVEKSNSSMADYRRFLDKFVDRLSILIEIYITAVIVGSIFFIIMGVIMGLMGGGNTLTLVRLVIYIGIPIISIMFMIMISGLSPE